jgi:zinc transport system ATP-binding protein
VAEPVVSFRGVTFSYGGEPVLEDVNLSVADREAVCIVGPNGGGKTTLVRLILGLLTPERGEIRIFGQPPWRARLRIGYMPQHVQHDPKFPVTALDIVLMGRLGFTGGCCSDTHRDDGEGAATTASRQSLWSRLTGWQGQADRHAAIEALARVDMSKFARQPYASLSGGQRQRVLIARALCGNPDLLLLDEPTSNVDTLIEGQLLDLLRELNRRMTIIMVSHDLGFVSDLVERVICVSRRVVIHRTSEMTGEAIRDIYGGEVRRVLHDDHSHRGHGHE